MSICIISDHNYAKTKFHYNPQHIDQVKPKSEGGASAPKAHPLDPPLPLALVASGPSAWTDFSFLCG